MRKVQQSAKQEPAVQVLDPPFAGVFALLATLAKNRSCSGVPVLADCSGVSVKNLKGEMWQSQSTHPGISRSTQILYCLVFVTRQGLASLAVARS